MNAEDLYLVAGDSEAMNFQLLKGDQPFDLTGMTVALSLYDSAGAPVVLSGTASIVTAASGTVRFTPTSPLVAVAAPLRVRWVAIDGAGKRKSFPRGRPMLWYIQP